MPKTKTEKPRRTAAQERAAINSRQNAFAGDWERIDGLTKREYMATQLMAAWITRHVSVSNDIAAQKAVEAADALLLRLEHA